MPPAPCATSSVADPAGVRLRPLEADDGEIAFGISGAAFSDLEQRRRRADAIQDARSGEDSGHWRPVYDAMVRQAALMDPDGSFIAEVDAQPAGIAISTIRDGLWVLNLLAVGPAFQSRGVGRALLAACAAYGERAPMGMIVSSDDPRAMRRYFRAGLSPSPMLYAEGVLDRSLLPATPRVREGDLERDADLLASVARSQRGAAYHPDDIRAAIGSLPLFVLDHGPSRGFSARGLDGVDLVVATDEAAARELLLAAIAAWDRPDRLRVGSFRGGQDWAIAVVLDLGLPLDFGGCLFRRGPLPHQHTFLPQDILA